MKKKVMTMVLAASMLLGMAGCGSSSANDSAAANGNTAGGDQAVAGTEKMMRQVMQKVVHKREHLLSGAGIHLT